MNIVKMISALLCLLAFVNPIVSLPASKCKIEDKACIEVAANAIAQEIYPGIPDLGIESLDPMYVAYYSGNVAGLTFKFINRTLIGQKNCKIKNLGIDFNMSNLKFSLECPSFKQVGKYELDGQLLIIPVHGKGDFNMISGKYIIDIDVEFKIKKHSDNKSYLSLKTFKLKAKPQEAFYFDFRNLFNGNKDLSDAIHNFAHDNWQELADVLQDPILYPIYEEIFKKTNIYLKKMPIEDLIENFIN